MTNPYGTWFAGLTDKQIRRGTFRSVPELIRAIRAYLRANNDVPRPFVWTATAKSILRKIEHCQETLETGR